MGSTATTPENDELPEGLKRYVRNRSLQADLPYVRYTPFEKMIRMLIMLSPLGWLQSLFRNYVVEEGQVGLIWENSEPKLLRPGRHVLLSPTTEFVSIVNINDPVIKHGPIEMINVKEGELAYLLDSETGRIELLTPGRHTIYSQTKKFKSFIDLNKPINELGTLKLIRVETGQIGIVYGSKGDLEIIEPGIHVIAPPRRFKEIASTQQEILELPATEFKGGDNVPLNIKADVFYTIKDPKKTFTVIKDVIKFIQDLAIATLGGIIQNSTVADVGQSSRPTYSGQKKDAVSDHTKTFTCRVHDDFVQQLHDHTLETYGVEISNIRIEALHIADENLAHQLSQQAVTRAQAEANLANIDAQNEVKMKEAQNAARQAETIAEGKAAALMLEAKAKADATRLQAEADAAAQHSLNDARIKFVTAMEGTETGRSLLPLEIGARALSAANTVYLPNNAQILTGLGVFAHDSRGGEQSGSVLLEGQALKKG